ncbi:conserved hypothetical protein [Chlorobium limicola DSM 245]|uniref:Uncharacterized protein n=1 Tax=Chlorobium limicola (strain DSM 245 / NBRC 103803 / 6330) TaxID=290315 RepID=B3EEJ1_CHLL2|nr:hypothetical protein [Chlorobium limicola]ACD90801.1 conserved hypothetical protein [Chlorobium limicola DSM 245]
MEIFKIVFTPILALIGVAIGAGLQFLISRSFETRKHMVTLRTQAYIDYISCVAESGNQRANDKQFFEILSKAADAKTRIAIYGSSAVLQALAQFEKGKPVIDSAESANRFLNLVSVMRSENINKNDLINTDDLKLVLFGDYEW